MDMDVEELLEIIEELHFMVLTHLLLKNKKN